MNTNNIRTCSALAAALFGAGASLAADIRYAADGSSGTYCGQGFGIAVYVATPSSGATIQYSTSSTGPWQDAEIEYTNACAATPIWFKISAEGYTSVTASQDVAIAPKELTDEFVWLTLPAQDYVYDGTAKTPKCSCADGSPSIITSNDFDVVFTDNVNAGTAKATFVGKRNYTGTVEEEFDIYPAMFPLDDEEPGDGEVPGDGESKFDTTSVYDGQGHTIDADALVRAFTDLVSECDVWYAPEEADIVSDMPPWSSSPPMYTNAGVYRVLYKVTKRNYEDYEHVAKVTITPRPLVIGAEAKTKVFGAGDPPLTYTNSALVGTDRITGALSREAGETIGAHPILQGSLTAGDNYAITYAGADLTINPATIRYAADGSSGTYCGQGFGIAVYVATPSSGATIQYSTSSTGPWQDAEIEYTNACAATPIWFKISAEGYTSVTASQDVAIAPKELTDEFVWLTLPAQDYVYDGTAKTPKCSCADGSPSIITSNDFDVVFTDNVNAGTAKATFTGKRNYTGTVEEEFEIGRAPFPGDGEEPGDGTVPQGGVSKFDTTSVYDGRGHTIDTRALVTAFAALLREDFQVSYAIDDPNVQPDARQWTPSVPAYTNVGEYTLWYRVTPRNYADFTHKAKVTITRRPIRVRADSKTKPLGTSDPPLTYTSEALIAGNSFRGKLVREPGERKGVYAIKIGSLTAGNNYEIAFTGASFTIVEANKVLTVSVGKWGKAQVVINGKAQNVGPNATKRISVPSGATVKATAVPDAGFAVVGAASASYGSFTKDASASFSFVPKLSGATIRWKFSAGVGRHFAQISIPSYAGYNEALAGFSFIFPDRKDAAGTLFAQLWDASKKAPYGGLVSDGGVAYRGVGLGASAFAGKGGGTRVIFGLSNATLAKADKIVPAGERKIGMYVRNRVNPSRGNESAADVGSFTGCLTWTTAGKRYYMPIVQGAANGPVTTTAAAARPSVPTYVIVFNANGGRGTMASQTVSRGAKAQLKACAFTHDGYKFAGWAKSAALAKKGTVAYKNRASVKNLAASGKSVTVYAVWKRK